MYGFKLVWQLMWHIPICITWLVMGALLTITYGVEGFDKFIVNWNKMVEDIG